MKLLTKITLFFAASMFLGSSLSAYNFSFHNTTKHNVCLDTLGGIATTDPLIPGKLKDIFNPAKKRYTHVSLNGTMHVYNAGFIEGKEDDLCIPPGRTKTFYFGDIDAGVCLDLANSKLGVPFREMKQKNLDTFYYGFRVPPLMKLDNRWLADITKSVALLGEELKEGVQDIEIEGDYGITKAATTLIGSITGPIAKLVAQSSCKHISFTIVNVFEPVCKKCPAKIKFFNELKKKGYYGLVLLTSAFGR